MNENDLANFERACAILAVPVDPYLDTELTVQERRWAIAYLRDLTLVEHAEYIVSLRAARRRTDVPHGSVVHHLDGNPYNNDPSNVQVMELDDRT